MMGLFTIVLALFSSVMAAALPPHPAHLPDDRSFAFFDLQWTESEKEQTSSLQILNSATYFRFANLQFMQPELEEFFYYRIGSKNRSINRILARKIYTEVMSTIEWMRAENAMVLLKAVKQNENSVPPLQWHFDMYNWLKYPKSFTKNSRKKILLNLGGDGTVFSIIPDWLRLRIENFYQENGARHSDLYKSLKRYVIRENFQSLKPFQGAIFNINGIEKVAAHANPTLSDNAPRFFVQIIPGTTLGITEVSSSFKRSIERQHFSQFD